MEKPRAQWKTEGLRGRPLESKCQLNGMSVTYGILMSFLDNQIIQIIIAMISGTVNQFEFLYNLWSFCIDSLTQHKYFDSLYCCMYQYFNRFFFNFWGISSYMDKPQFIFGEMFEILLNNLAGYEILLYVYPHSFFFFFFFLLSNMYFFLNFILFLNFT